jgi:hypothetical protein
MLSQIKDILLGPILCRYVCLLLLVSYPLFLHLCSMFPFFSFVKLLYKLDREHPKKRIKTESWHRKPLYSSLGRLSCRNRIIHFTKHGITKSFVIICKFAATIFLGRSFKILLN